MIGIKNKCSLKGDIKVQKEAAWAINNLFSGGSVIQKSELLSLGILEPYCSLLLSQDIRMVEIILEGLVQLLEVRNHMLAEFIFSRECIF